MNSAAITSVTMRTQKRTISSMIHQRKKGMMHWRLKPYSSFKRPIRLSSGAWQSALASLSIDISEHVTLTQQLIGSLWCPSSVFLTCGSLTEFKNSWLSMALASPSPSQRETNTTLTLTNPTYNLWRLQWDPWTIKSPPSCTTPRPKPWMNSSATFKTTCKIVSALRTSIKTRCYLRSWRWQRDSSLNSWLRLRWCSCRCSRRTGTGGSWPGRPWTQRGCRGLLSR